MREREAEPVDSLGDAAAAGQTEGRISAKKDRA
jgi:hypothetical protein